MMTRRSFAFVLASAVALGLSSAAVTADAEETLKFELYADAAGQYRWRLRAGNGKILATSGEGYKAKAGAKNGIERIKQDAETLPFEIYEDAKKETRWRVKAKNGQVIGASSEGYKARADAEAAVSLIKERAKSAEVSDETK